MKSFFKNSRIICDKNPEEREKNRRNNNRSFLLTTSIVKLYLKTKTFFSPFLCWEFKCLILHACEFMNTQSWQVGMLLTFVVAL